jgi:hypothetical protein
MLLGQKTIVIRHIYFEELDGGWNQCLDGHREQAIQVEQLEFRVGDENLLEEMLLSVLLKRWSRFLKLYRGLKNNCRAQGWIPSLHGRRVSGARAKGRAVRPVQTFPESLGMKGRRKDAPNGQTPMAQ